MKKFIFFAIINLISAFDICIVGCSSGLGKELIYQSLEKNKKVLALTNNPNKVCIPYRGKGLTEIYNKNELISNNNLILDKYKNSNLGIQIMNNWYLNEVYNNKNKQEKYLQDFTKNTNINLKIFRPKVLAYGDNIINAKTRKDFATEIIDLIF